MEIATIGLDLAKHVFQVHAGRSRRPASSSGSAWRQQAGEGC